MPDITLGAENAPAVEIATAAKRVQLFPGYGTWYGRNGGGPYTITDRAHAEQIIAATLARQNGTDMMIDYDHQAVRAPAVAGTAAAAGWFRQLSADNKGIWAEGVEWTGTAAAQIAAREYRYVSPYFFHDKAGRITVIINAALVNIPNFDMQAVAASAVLAPAATITAAERAIIDRMGLSDATYLSARAERERADRDREAAAAASALRPAPGYISPAERRIIDMVGITPEAYLATRDAA